MRLKQTGALLLASVMMVGTIGLMNPVQAQAAAPTNQYTLTVPAETELNYDGTAVALKNGLIVSDGDLEDGKKVTVTAESANEWKLTGSKTETTTTIAYGLYATPVATETTTSWDFSKEDADSDGKAVEIYSKIKADDYKKAAADDYSDTITFTAKVENAATAGPAAGALTTGARYNLTYEYASYSYSFTFEKKEDGFELVDVNCGGSTNLDFYKSMYSSTANGSKIVCQSSGTTIFELDTATNEYEIYSGFTITNFSVKPAGASDFTDLTSTLSAKK